MAAASGTSQSTTFTGSGSATAECPPVACRYFLSNACVMGSDCRFSHDRNLGKAETVCRFYLAGNCSFGNRCRYDHVRNRQESAHQPKLVRRKTETTSGVATVEPNLLCPHGGPALPGGSGVDKQESGMDSASQLSPKMPEGSVSDAQEGVVDAHPLIHSILKAPLRPDAEEFIPQYVVSPPHATDSQFTSAADESHTDFTPVFSSYAGAVSGVDGEVAGEGVGTQDILCPYHIMGHCYYGDNCSYAHGNLCDLCARPILHPADPQQNTRHRHECMAAYEAEMEESFAVARSKDKACGICMEVVMEKKEVTGRRFGILQNCKHVYCLECIRKWRVQNKTGAMGKEVVRTCPQCRVASDFVTPSSMWVEDEQEKEELIVSYKQALGDKKCKYFKEGKSECPFGNKCFYKHCKPDGTVVQGDSPRSVRRRMLEAARQERRRNPDTFFLWDYLDARDLPEWSDSEDSWGDPDYGFGNASWDSLYSHSDEDSGDLPLDQQPWLVRALQHEFDFLTFSRPRSSPRNQAEQPQASASQVSDGVREVVEDVRERDEGATASGSSNPAQRDRAPQGRRQQGSSVPLRTTTNRGRGGERGGGRARAHSGTARGGRGSVRATNRSTRGRGWSRGDIGGDHPESVFLDFQISSVWRMSSSSSEEDLPSFFLH